MAVYDALENDVVIAIVQYGTDENY